MYFILNISHNFHHVSNLSVVLRGIALRYLYVFIFISILYYHLLLYILILFIIHFLYIILCILFQLFLFTFEHFSIISQSLSSVALCYITFKLSLTLLKPFKKTVGQV